MKPPTRTRSKPVRYQDQTSDYKRKQNARKLVCTWKRAEQRSLLIALRRLGKTGKCEIDYVFLNKFVPRRSELEIRLLVESLQKKMVNSVAQQVMRQRREERRAKKPIELWVDMASSMAGALEEPISSAFRQMLLVSSTEPRSLMNSHPSNIHHTNKPKPTDDCNIPCKSIPHPNVQDTILLSSPSQSTPGVAVETKATIQCKREDILGTDAKGIVDFEKIYHYLSTIKGDNEEWTLTPMESAILLDMVMSLPEELVKLDCKTLERHMIEMYTRVSAPADSKMSREMFAEQGPETEGYGKVCQVTQSSEKDPLKIFTGIGDATVPNKDSDTSKTICSTQSFTAQEETPCNLLGHEAESNVVMKSVESQESTKRVTASGSVITRQNDQRAKVECTESKNSFSLIGNLDKLKICPLNPFMVPLKLLTRKQ